MGECLGIGHFSHLTIRFGSRWFDEPLGYIWYQSVCGFLGRLRLSR